MKCQWLGVIQQVEDEHLTHTLQMQNLQLGALQHNRRIWELREIGTPKAVRGKGIGGILRQN